MTLVTLALLQVFTVAAAVAGTPYLIGDEVVTAAPKQLRARQMPLVTAGPVLVPAPGGAAAGRVDIARELDRAMATPALGGGVAAVVIDPVTRRVLYARRADSPATPASTTKIVTAVAALGSLGTDHRLATRVVWGSGSEPGGPKAKKEIILVGGGDPSLAGSKPRPGGYPSYASLPDLAAKTAAALKAAGVREVKLTYDDSLYSGPRLGPGWKPNYVPEGSVAPITALMMNGGRRHPGTSTRVNDPSAYTAERFADLLSERGVKVGRPARGRAAEEAPTEIARVESPPVSALVEQMLTDSDNEMAEALARQVALKGGQPASFDGGARAVHAALRRLGVEKGVEVHDGSGLSPRNKITPNALAGLVALAANPDHPALRAAVTGLPIGGFTGTLAGRYTDDGSRSGAGVVRAKTGTLSGVSTLSGVAYTSGGGMLAFALMADRLPADAYAPPALDRLASIVARAS
ncbi:D-alanyl-D-alanine carboxypeptidase/D-alanyl-D-alanine endopeptidase [Bailinhaonella thermotolerans]|uniref:D-alanyl-D-alanine carboxypeptidase/D-alanyl-D-alanine endopeptidase n=1 Tax=Bailinhaonella thermotolerans TaxID=1070861 RepID=UPI001F5B12EA|nr:D-alanyl-D-alanine carboxypeptidase/D-alanyl-D-alanine-endopeptidase [Bailinhaonella thermotolerans]